MFFCNILKKTSEPGEKVFRVVVDKRERTYTRRIRDEDTNEWVTVEVARGWEIVKEVQACAEGVEAWNSLSDSEREKFARALCGK